MYLEQPVLELFYFSSEHKLLRIVSNKFGLQFDRRHRLQPVKSNKIHYYAMIQDFCKG